MHESADSNDPAARRGSGTIATSAALAVAFAVLVTAAITAPRWLATLGAGAIIAGQPAPLTVRVPALAGYDTPDGHIGNGGVVIARGDVATASDVANVHAIEAASPKPPAIYVVVFAIAFALAAVFIRHMTRSPRGRLVRVQVISLGLIVGLAVTVKALLLLTAVSVLAIPVAAFALAPAIAVDRTVGLATGLLAAVVVALLGPFDVAITLILLIQAAIAGFVEQPHERVRAIAITGLATMVGTVASYAVLGYLTTGTLPAVADPVHSGWLAAIVGPVLAIAIAIPATAMLARPSNGPSAVINLVVPARGERGERSDRVEPPRSRPEAVIVEPVERALAPSPHGVTLLGSAPAPAQLADDLEPAPPRYEPAPTTDESPSRPPLGPDDATPAIPHEPVSAMLMSEPPPEARKRAATLPPTPTRRAPTVPPPAAPARRTPSSPPPSSSTPGSVPLLTRTAGPPAPVSLDNAVTNPPMTRSAGSRPPANQGPRRAALIVDEDEVRVTLKRIAVNAEGEPLTDDDKTRETKAAPPGERDHELDDPATTVPMMRVRPPTLPDPPPTKQGPPAGWSRNLAARVDAALDGDEWSNETPVVAPTKAELRMLLGTPDPTREQSIEEVEALHRVAAAEAAAAYEAQPELLPRRPLPNTAEVDPDDIEAAIEIAPPARKPSTAIAVAKTTPKKPE
ncbi:MAG: hypothetical protein AB7O24_26755 [Kofleriaceae bacterium]